MKKVTLALTALFALGLTACSSNSQNDQNVYKGQVIFSQYEGENLKLSIRKNDCSNSQEGAVETLVHHYDSTLVVGACVRVSDDGKGVKNISTWSPRNPI